MKKMKALLASVLSLVMAVSLLTGCGPQAGTQNPAKGGTLLLKVNPEIAVIYGENGNVTAVESRNEDAKKLLEKYTDFTGKETKTVVKELVTIIGEAGYFVEEIEGERKHIVIEFEKGSGVPYDKFIDGVVGEVKTTVQDKRWYSPLDVIDGTDYGLTDYVDTDYGPGNDGITDYIDTDYGEGNDGVTDFYDTDYGYANDGITDFGRTDYNDTDYGPNNDGVTDFGKTDYDDTDYGPNNDGVTDFGKTDYNDTDYGPNNDGVTDFGKTDYDDTDYGPNNDGVTDYTDYHKPAPTAAPTAKPAKAEAPAQAPAKGHTDYTDYKEPETDYHKTDYGKTDYDKTDYDSHSNYSDYDD